MHKFLKNLSCLLLLVLIFAGCRKKAFDAFYDAPASLQPPVYQVLQSQGNFTNLLALIDRAGYKNLLSTGGYWTFFAPDDAAFQTYFTANNTSLDKIDSVTAGKIVKYALIFNQFKTDHISDYQSPTGYITGSAFKRRTAYYDGFTTGPGPDGANTVLVTENRDFGSYVYGDNNNKYIPYFYSTFMTQAGLSAADYNYFFPNTTYTGFNVINAKVVKADILAQNGVIHEIDQVLTPLPSIEQKLASNTQYAYFKSIYDTYLTTFVKDVNYTRQYNTLTNLPNSAYVKLYNGGLTFAPGNESFIKLENDDSQKDGYTLFAPTDAAFKPFVQNTILEFYGTLAALPSTVLLDLMNSYMFQTMVWPTKFTSKANQAGEPPRFNATSNVIDKQFCSNGLFYGVNTYQAANVFTTVYARAYLDPAYSIETRLLDLTAKAAISSPGLKYTLLLIPDAVFRAAGYDFSQANQVFTSTTNGTTVSTGVQTILQRIINYCIIPTPNNELNNLAGNGIIESNGGEYLRYYNNAFYTAGSVETQRSIGVTGSRDYSNGRVYYINSVPDLPVKTVANDILANAGTTAAPGPYYDFYQYLINSAAYQVAATEILGVSLGVKYTVFIPTQAAMKQAVVDGYLPGTTTVVNGVKTFATFTYNPTTASDRALVSNFIFYHIINGIAIAPDGKKGGGVGASFPTLLKTITGDAINVYVTNAVNNLQVQDNQSRVSTVLPAIPNPNTLPGQTSNYLGDYTLIHQINSYLRPN